MPTPLVKLISPARAPRSTSSRIFSIVPLGSPRCGPADSCDSVTRRLDHRRSGSERGPEPLRRVLVPARRTEVPAVVADVDRSRVARLPSRAWAPRRGARTRRNRCGCPMRCRALSSAVPADAAAREPDRGRADAATRVGRVAGGCRYPLSGQLDRDRHERALLASDARRTPHRSSRTSNRSGSFAQSHGTYGATTHCAEIGSKTEPTITPQPALIRPRSAETPTTARFSE